MGYMHIIHQQTGERMAAFLKENRMAGPHFRNRDVRAQTQTTRNDCK